MAVTMANYKRGVNRLFYQPSSFHSAVVEAYFYTPKLVKTETYIFTELENGLYYLDYKFEDIGEYLGIFFEDSIKIASKVFKVELGYSLWWITPEGKQEPLM